MTTANCPNCGAEAEFKSMDAHLIETHGLDCGPYEEFHDEWLVCQECDAPCTDKELTEANKEEE